MENIWFDWTTNIDFMDLLKRPIIKTDAQIKRSQQKRLKARQKRKSKK